MSEVFTGFYPFLFERRGIMYDAMHTFVHPHDGYRLSDRIWRSSQKTRNRINMLLAHEIRNGTSAVDTAKQLEGFLRPERAGVLTRKPYGRLGSYDARRLARTEITAAHGRATLGSAEANPFVQALKWALSAFRDDWDCNCEPNAEADSGLGPGVYELGSVPDYPDHPHCMCVLGPQVVAKPSDVVADLRDWLDGEPGAPSTIDLFGWGGDPGTGLVQGGLPEPMGAKPAKAEAQGVVGKLVSQALDLARIPKTARSSFGQNIRKAIKIIDRTHTDGDLPEIPVMPSSTRSVLGSYATTARGKAIKITVSRSGSHQGMTTLHEVGHFLDHQGIGEKGKFASVVDDRLAEWRAAVKNSKAVKQFDDLYRTPSLRVGPTGAEFDYVPDRRFIRYSLETEELFARSYAQYIATKSQNAALQAELAEELKEKGLVHYPSQWAPDDFEAIAKAFDGLFQVLGWLR